MAVVEILDGVVGPAAAPVNPFLRVHGGDGLKPDFQFGQGEVEQWAWRVPDRLPILAEVGDLDALQVPRHSHEVQPEQVWARISDVMIVVQVRRRGHDQVCRGGGQIGGKFQ